MTQNKKLSYILIFLVILPILTILLFEKLDSAGTIGLQTSTLNRISDLGLSISIISSFVIIVLNARSQTPKSFWYTIPTTFIVVLLILFYFGYSLSHFGF